MFKRKRSALSAGLFGLTLSLILSLLLVACGDDNSSDPPGDLPATRLNLAACEAAGATLTARAGQPTATVNPQPGLRVEVPTGFRLYPSTTQPYAVAIPLEWDVKDHQTQGNIKDADLFIIKKSSTSGAYVTIFSEKLKDNLDSKTFFDSKFKDAVATQKTQYDQQGTRQIGGSEAYILAYNTQAGQSFAYPVQSVQAIFVGQGRGWSVTFTASPNQASQYCPFFARALSTWTFTGLVK